MTRDERLADLCELPFDLLPYLPSVYRTFATEGTEEFFRTIHRGLTLICMQAMLSTSERLSCVSPDGALAYERVLWTQVTAGAGGTLTLSPAPHLILGLKNTISTEPDWAPGSSYDRASGIVSGLVAGQAYWIPEMLYGNPWVWKHLLKPLGIFPGDTPSKYGPLHLPAYANLVRAGIRSGISTAMFKWFVSGLCGNPFAYQAGTVTAVTVEGIEITTEAGDVVLCDVPDVSVAADLVIVGTVVGRFQPLLRTPAVTVSIGGQQERAWTTPVDILLSENDQITFSGPAPECAFADRIRVRGIGTGFDETYLVRARLANMVVVEGAVPAFTASSLGVAQVLTASPGGASSVEVAAQSVFSNADPAMVDALVRRALPMTLSLALTVS